MSLSASTRVEDTVCVCPDGEADITVRVLAHAAELARNPDNLEDLAHAKLGAAEQERLTELLEINRTTGLSSAQEDELDAPFDRVVETTADLVAARIALSATRRS